VIGKKFIADAEVLLKRTKLVYRRHQQVGVYFQSVIRKYTAFMKNMIPFIDVWNKCLRWIINYFKNFDHKKEQDRLRWEESKRQGFPNGETKEPVQVCDEDTEFIQLKETLSELLPRAFINYYMKRQMCSDNTDYPELNTFLKDKITSNTKVWSPEDLSNNATQVARAAAFLPAAAITRGIGTPGTPGSLDVGDSVYRVRKGGRKTKKKRKVKKTRKRRHKKWKKKKTRRHKKRKTRKKRK
jgi:hypothetical protein